LQNDRHYASFSNKPNSYPAAVLPEKGKMLGGQKKSMKQRKSALRLRVYKAPAAIP
jgi:hypothetical protein